MEKWKLCNCGAFLKVFITDDVVSQEFLRLLIAFFEEKVLYTHIFHKLYNTTYKIYIHIT